VHFKPKYWGDAVNLGEVQGNGTVFFLNTGEHVLAVTNDHVVGVILDRVAADPRLTVQIGNLPIDVQRQLIDRVLGWISAPCAFPKRR
jgi:hypothetical protein